MRHAIIILGLLLLGACSQVELYGQQTESQANDMVAVLRNAGIEARKEPAGELGWRVTAPDADFARAIETLRRTGYPRPEHDNLGQIFKKSGFVSSQLEERARLTFGLQEELARTLSTIDGVIEARVHLALPEQNSMADRPRPASAAIAIYHRPDVNLQRQQARIKALVVNSIDGLPYENVSVQMFSAQTLPTVAPARAGPQLTIASLGALALIGAAAGAGMLAYPSLAGRVRRRLGAASPAACEPGAESAQPDEPSATKLA